MKCILIKKKECKKSIKVPHVSFSETAANPTRAMDSKRRS